jgi:hypothetical protein
VLPPVYGMWRRETGGPAAELGERSQRAAYDVSINVSIPLPSSSTTASRWDGEAVDLQPAKVRSPSATSRSCGHVPAAVEHEIRW